MLRITLLHHTDEEEAYALEGWVVDEQVDLLAQTCGPARQQGRRLVLDLSGVRSLDERGLALLAGWAGGGLVLRRGSAFVGQLLDNGGVARADSNGLAG